MAVKNIMAMCIYFCHCLGAESPKGNRVTANNLDPWGPWTALWEPYDTESLLGKKTRVPWFSVICFKFLKKVSQKS